MTRIAALALALAAAAALAVAAPAAPERLDAAAARERLLQSSLLKQPKLKWWQTGIVYQVYPASFKDSDDDGVGDLKGITSKLEYLRDLGVAAVWLSPIFKSPNKDMGYDISDYKDIQPEYGTLEDFEEMVEKAHSLGLKVILDFVLNHSSDEHRWFVEALKGPENEYHDYYVWHEGTRDEDDEPQPPTNWGSVFDDMKAGSAWQWVPSLEKYYYRTFHQAQPDLNYNNPAVVKEIKNVFRFWTRKGVDGFRIDAIPYLFEDPLMRDNSEGGSERTENLPQTYDMVRQWRQVLDEEGALLGKDLVMMMEAYASLEETMEYYGSKDFPAGHFPFNFQIISHINGTSTADTYKDIISEWVDAIPYYGWSNWVVGNHDNHRVGSRLGEDNVDGINMLVALLPGTAVTYYGEELGMLDNANLTVADCKDPQACPDGEDTAEEYYREHSRDYERTPMQWDTSEHAGFTGGTPWLAVPDSYIERNVETEEQLEKSHLNNYKKLAALRKESVVQTGTLKIKSDGNVLSFLRQNDTYSLLVLMNLDEIPASFNITEHYSYIGDLKEIISSSNFDEETINLRNLTLNGNAAVVLAGQRYAWWQTGIVYQIYPRSFKDEIKTDEAEDEGIGDLQGITNKLNYLKELGVTAVWLSPIFDSPNLDMGYDISDFRGIYKPFGNMTDFENMVEEAHKLGLKVVLDFVPNHSSSEHEWFKAALNNEQPYVDYYVWKPPKENPDAEPGDPPLPPNNWRSVFDDSEDGTAWTYNEDLQKFYLHQFLPEQPDLNFNNQDVVDEIKDVLRFWIRKGVDGFRVDAISHLFEDSQFRDNPDGSSEYLKHQPETYDMVQQWRELLEEEGKALNKTLVLMLEAMASGEQLQMYFGTGDRPGGHFPFNFNFLAWDKAKEKFVTAQAVNDAISNWNEVLPEHGWSNWVIGNHDTHRVGSRVGEDLIDAFNMLVALLPGTAITYYGEEIGMLDNRDITYEQCEDVQACPDQTNNSSDAIQYYEEHSRDFERTPFQWDTSDNAGFCSDCTPWLPVHTNFKEVNTEVEDSTRKSHLFNYKKLANLRKEPAIQSGALANSVIDDTDVLYVSRKNDSYAYILLINFGEEEAVVNIAEILEEVGTVKETVSSGFQSTDVDLSAVRLAGHASVVLEGALRSRTTEPEDLKWWQKGIIYQIYPRSFQDTDGDGIGDLKGITSRLEYLRDLGVSAIWLSPIFSSPDADMGYDISDFSNINEIFGTMGDFDEMIIQAHSLGLKVILDFVPNHSSDEHEWFKDVLAKGTSSDYYDYYVWRDGTDGGVPNNWEDAFTNLPGSAWAKYNNTEMNMETNQYYLHQFHKKQPDLNYRNPDLVQAMKDVLSFWVRRGVDGFRVDAIQHLGEDKEFRDNDNGLNMQKDQDLTYEILKQWRDLLDREGSLLQKDLVIMLEVYAKADTLMKYFGPELRPAGDFPFNFLMISKIKAENLNAENVTAIIEEWENNKPENRWSNWVVGNHDQTRIGTRFGSSLIDGFNMLVTLLPGTAITYNGEEIGMLDNKDLTVDDCQDPQACPDDVEGDRQEYYESKSRDYQRTPFQWDDSENAGFTTGTPWLPVNANHKTLNVKAQENDPNSSLSVYKKLAALRKELAIQRGEFHIETLGNNVLSFSRRNVSHAYVVLINFDDEDVEVELNAVEAYVDLPKMLIYVSSSNFNDSTIEEVDLGSFPLPAYASVVLTSEPVVDDDDFSDPEYPDSETTTLGASAASPMGLLLVTVLALACFLRT